MRGGGTGSCLPPDVVRRGAATDLMDHGASRRRARSPAERVRARPEVDLMINRRRDRIINAGAVSEGCSNECQWFVGCPSKTRRRRTRWTPTASQGHPTPNFALPGARALIEGSARDPYPPHRNRAYGHGHETSPQRGRWSPVRYLGRQRPTADCRKRRWHFEHGNAAAVVGSDRTLTLNVERQVGR